MWMNTSLTEAESQTLDLRQMDRVKTDYANFLRSTVRSISQVGGQASENLMIARYFDRVIVRACAASIDKVIEELKGK